ncbi:MAG: HAD-IA family hydrolase [Desulfobulbaceae bacterium]|uniref:HAD-IA family hydrolase n=1 Tax=Candidatus Desulfobia pelagia TaxID=2841692 RepID=A0A8J6TD12_9BACT|nr:HAD-IA family hydrolase [Candidatus Desulfobia pelagia]
MKNKKIPVPSLDWNTIETVMLDMDGTLLDKHFDDYFWEEHVPEVYAKENNINFWKAHEVLMEKYRSREGTLDWTDINYWSKELHLDLAGMKEKMNHLIQVHPYVIDFLDFCRKKGKQIHLVTNAHSKTLSIKMAKTEIESHFDQIICSEEIGLPKEDPIFWQRLAEKTGFKKETSILADDNEAVLASAATYGIENLIFVAKSSSMKPVVYSAEFPSIIFFKELMEG